MLIVGIFRVVRGHGLCEGVRTTMADPVARANAAVAVEAAKDLAHRYATARDSVAPPPGNINIHFKGAGIPEKTGDEDSLLERGGRGGYEPRPRL